MVFMQHFVLHGRVSMSFSVAFWFSLAALLLSALSVLWAAFGGRSAHRHPTLEKRLRDVDAGLVDCLDGLDKLTAVAKRKYARDVMRTKRAEDKANGQLSDDDWKKQMNLKYALGKAGVPTDGN